MDDDYFIWSIFPSITYDTRNHFWNPTAGEYAKLQLEGGYANGYDGDVFGNEEEADKDDFEHRDGKYYWREGNRSEVKGLDDDYFIWSIFPSNTYDTRNHFWNPTA